MSEPVEIDWDRLVLIAGGHTAFQLLWAGIELGVFDRLSQRPGQTLEEVASGAGLQPYPTRILMIGLTALGLVRLADDGTYRNATLTENRLVRGKPGYAAPILHWQAHIVYPGMQDFLQSLRENRNAGLARFPGDEPTLYERLTHDARLEQLFQISMSALSKQANQFLPKVMDFSRFRLVVDAGGGDGTNAISIARAYPGVRTTVFDLESVCELAARNIAQQGMSERVGTWVGDFFESDFPPGADCIVYCHIMTIWSMQRNKALLKRTYDALPEGGAVVLFNMMGSDDDRGPLATALGSPYFLAIATGEGMLWPWKDYEEALREVGFRDTVRMDKDLPLDHGILVGIK